MSAKEEYIIGGFIFEDENDAKEAKADLDKIKMLDGKLNYEHFDSVALVYDRALDNKIFTTVIGEHYTKKLQEHLIANKDEESDYEVRPIRLKRNPDNAEDNDENQNNANQEDSANKFGETIVLSNGKTAKVRVGQNKELKEKLRFSIIINIGLAAIIVVLFIIALTGSNPNIINYKNAIIKQYVNWDKQLTEREAAIREKEKELDINQ